MLRVKKEQIINRLEKNVEIMSNLLKSYNFTPKEDFELRMELGNTYTLIDLLKLNTRIEK